MKPDRQKKAQSDFTGFSRESFQFFTDLLNNNNRQWFHDHHKFFLKNVDQPLRALVNALAPFMHRHIPEMETAAKAGKTISRINKNIFGSVETGLYNSDYWAAFYRKQFTKQTDIQFSISMRADGLYVGLFCSFRASIILETLRRRILNNGPRFLALIKGQRFPFSIYTDESITQPLLIQNEADLADLQNGKCLAILRHFAVNDELLTSPRLISQLEETFEILLPIYHLATNNTNDSLEIDAVLEPEEAEPEVDLTYDIDDLKRDTLLEESFIKRIESLLLHKKQIIFYGPPGTGKTYLATKFANYFLQGKGEYRLIQFHPAYSYEDFMEGIRPETEPSENGQMVVGYRVVDGIIKKFSEQARNGGKDAKYVLIIDEINRGNPARIFGELLYLLEYRNENVELPYSKRPFTLPQNLFIIGTMNTADRSIALVDHALRRRFHFIPLAPDIAILRRFLAENRPGYEWIAELLARLNQQLAAHGISKEYHIGHSHFMTKTISENELQLIWDFTILPTIEEYFHNRMELLAKYQLRELSRGLIDQELLTA